MGLLEFVREAVAVILMLGGVGFMLIGSIGINTLPDFYARCHAAGKVDTLGILLVLAGMMVHEGLHLNSLKLLLVICFVLVTSRASYEMVAKAAACNIQLLAAVSAPTSLAVSQARLSGLTLVGFLQSGRQAIYANPQRMLGEP